MLVAERTAEIARSRRTAAPRDRDRDDLRPRSRPSCSTWTARSSTPRGCGGRRWRRWPPGSGTGSTEADQPEVLGRPVEHTAAWLAGITGAPGRRDSPPSCTGSSRTGSAPASCPAPARSSCSTPWPGEGVPTALVTASPRAVADTVLDALGADRFAVSVTADDTERTKPAPDPYLAACRALGVDPAACVAVEDTRDGRRLGRGGGLRGARGALARPDRRGARTDRTGQPGGGDPGAAARPWSRRHASCA